DAGIREHNVELALLPLDLCEQAIEVSEPGHVALNAGDLAADLFLRHVEFCRAASCNKHIRAFCNESLRRRQTDAAIAAGDECHLAFEFSTHCDRSLFGCVNASQIATALAVRESIFAVI